MQRATRFFLVLVAGLALAGCATGYGNGNGYGDPYGGGYGDPYGNGSSYPNDPYYPGGSYGNQNGSQRLLATVVATLRSAEEHERRLHPVRRYDPPSASAQQAPGQATEERGDYRSRENAVHREAVYGGRPRARCAQDSTCLKRAE